jgi:hypothetical protein
LFAGIHVDTRVSVRHGRSISHVNPSSVGCSCLGGRSATYAILLEHTMMHVSNCNSGASRLILGVLYLAGTWLGASAPAAPVHVDVYQANVPVADRSEAGHVAAVQAALKIVLERVTGRRPGDIDPQLAPLLGEARRYVQKYQSLPNGLLAVSFDGPAIDRRLALSGAPVWGPDRPSTFVWLMVQTGPQGGFIVTREDASELKTAIDAEAGARGIPLAWPSAQDLRGYHLDYASLSSAASGLLADTAHRLGGDATLIGRASNATGAAAVRWTLVFQDHGSEATGALEGVDRLADTFASQFATSGTLAPIDIDVDGIEDVRQYASVENYLASLTFVTHVNVAAMSTDTVRFRLTMRGGIEPLQRAFALGGLLLPRGEGAAGVQRFHLRQ